jgi:hypothetical protein
MQTDLTYLAPRTIRPVQDPLALFVRAGRQDQPALLDLLARHDANFFGLVIEATSVSAQRELRDQATANRLDLILDPRTAPSATLGGYSASMGLLPWGEGRAHTIDDFAGLAGRDRVGEVASFAIANGFSQVLAPSHVLSSSHDPWIDADVANVRHLRNALDRGGGTRIDILYPLAIPYKVFRNPHEREALVDMMRGLPLNAVWLQIDGLGAHATANGVRNYIAGAEDFKSLGVPVIADGIGVIAALAVLGFGAAGGIAHGVAVGERVDHAVWKRARAGTPFGRTRRVYLREIDLLLEPDEAEGLLKSSTRAMSTLACRDTQCCLRGLADMIENCKRHFLIQRMAQINALSRLPPNIRPVELIDRVVRPVSDTLVRVSNWTIEDLALQKRIGEQRRRIDTMRIALGNDMDAARQRAVVLPQVRRAREHRVGL